MSIELGELLKKSVSVLVYVSTQIFYLTSGSTFLLDIHRLILNDLNIEELFKSARNLLDNV